MTTSRLYSCIVQLALLSLPLAAQSASELPRFLLEQLDVIVEGEMATERIPGLSIAVAERGRIQFARGYGMADLENSVPVSTSTVFRTASIAKPMTATAVMQLVEQGKMELDGPIQAYCSAFPEKLHQVTLRHLLGHLGGVRHYRDASETILTGHFTSLGDALTLFNRDPLEHEPGTKYLYTTYGYNLLGCAVEQVSGMRFEEYMAEHIFGPAWMTQTRTDDHYALISHRARGYLRVEPDDIEALPVDQRATRRAGDVLNAPLHDTSVKVPGGGLVSTPLDLLRFARALESGELLKKETLEQMWVSQSTSDGKPTGYGLGWKVEVVAGHRMISHGGQQAGVRTLLVIFPERSLSIATMCNLQNASLESLMGKVARLLAEPGLPVDE